MQELGKAHRVSRSSLASKPGGAPVVASVGAAGRWAVPDAGGCGGTLAAGAMIPVRAVYDTSGTTDTGAQAEVRWMEMLQQISLSTSA